MAINIYTTPPNWFKRLRGNDKAELKLTKRGWEAIFPDGRTEIIISMKNVPEQYLGETSKKEEISNEAKPEPVPEVKEEIPEVKEEEAPVAEEAPKKKSRKKATTEE